MEEMSGRSRVNISFKLNRARCGLPFISPLLLRRFFTLYARKNYAKVENNLFTWSGKDSAKRREKTRSGTYFSLFVFSVYCDSPLTLVNLIPLKKPPRV